MYTISPNFRFHGNHTNFGIILKTQISIVFQVIPPERNFLWDNLLCFGHHNTLRSLIIANIRAVTMEIFQKNLFAQIRSSTLKQLICAMFQSLKSAFYATGILSGVLSLFLTIFLAHSSVLSLVVAPAPTLTALAVPASN